MFSVFVRENNVYNKYSEITVSVLVTELHHSIHPKGPFLHLFQMENITGVVIRTTHFSYKNYKGWPNCATNNR